MYLTPTDLAASMKLNWILVKNRRARKMIGLLVVLFRILCIGLFFLRFVFYRFHFAQWLHGKDKVIILIVILWFIIELIYQYIISHFVVGTLGLKYKDLTFILKDQGLFVISNANRQRSYSLTLKQYEDLMHELEQILSQYKQPKMRIIGLCLNDFLAEIEETVSI